MANNNMAHDNPSFVHSFRTLVHYQKNVLKTLVTNKIEQSQNDAIKTEDKVLSISDMEDADEANQSNDSLFQYFIQKIQKASANGCKVTILCSHVTHNDDNKTGIRFPFIQYLLEKKAFNHRYFDLPSIMLDSDDVKNESSCENIVTSYISRLYRTVSPNAAELTVDNCYVGACHLGENKDIYVMLDVSLIWSDIHYAGISSKNQVSFALPSEIINTRRVCGFAVEEKTAHLFAEYPELTKLHSHGHSGTSVEPNQNTFPVPDVGYTLAPDLLSARFACMFGPPKTIDIHTEMNDASFHFQSDLQPLANEKNEINKEKEKEKEKAKANAKAVTRYAVYYPEDKPIYDYDLFLPMTYHILNATKDCIL